MARPGKSAEYYTHDSDMRNDVRVKALRRTFGHMGYAVWCFLLEALTDSPDFELAFGEIDQELLAADFDVAVCDLKAIVDYCLKIKLLDLTDDGKLFSHNHKSRFESLIVKREKLAAAGRRGMARRWEKEAAESDNHLITSDNQVITSDNHLITSDNRVEESRVEESRVKKKENTHYVSVEKKTLAQNFSSNFSLEDVKSVADDPEIARLTPTDYDIETFYDYYAARGWMIGNRPMRSLKPAFRGWLKKRANFAVDRDALEQERIRRNKASSPPPVEQEQGHLKGKELEDLLSKYGHNNKTKSKPATQKNEYNQPNQSMR